MEKTCCRSFISPFLRSIQAIEGDLADGLLGFSMSVKLLTADAEVLV